MEMPEKFENTLIVGRNAVLEALYEGVQIEKIYLQTGITGDFEKAIRHQCKDKEVPLQSVPKEKLNRMTKVNHQGVVGLKALVTFHDINNVIAHVYEKGKVPLIAMLEEITDVRNLGAIARSALAFGVDGIVIPLTGAAPIQADSIKSSSGALLKIPVCRVKNFSEAINILRDNGLMIYATGLDKAKSLSQIDFKEPTAILFGSEERGVSPHLLRMCDEVIKISQSDEIESLNVSVAAGIVLSRVFEQRMD